MITRRILILTLTLSLLSHTPPAWTQETKPEKSPPPVVTLRVQQQPLSEILADYARQTKLSLVAKSLPDIKLTLNLERVPAEAALQTIAEVADLNVTLKGQTLQVMPKAKKEKEAELGLFQDDEQNKEEESAQNKDSSSDDRIYQNQDVTIAADEVITGDVTIQNGCLTVKGRVKGDVVVAGNVTIEEGAAIEGDLISIVGNIQVGKRAWVGGDISAFGGRLDIDPSATIKGSRINIMPRLGKIAGWFREHSSNKRAHSSHSDSSQSLNQLPGQHVWERIWSRFETLTWLLITTLILTLCALLTLHWAPRRLERMTHKLFSAPALCFLAGCGATLGIVPFSVLLIMTVVGVLVLPLFYCVLPLLFLVGFFAVALAMGHKLGGHRVTQSSRRMVLGMITLCLLSALPYLGTLLLIVSLMAGLGALLLSRLGRAAPSTFTPPPATDNLTPHILG